MMFRLQLVHINMAAAFPPAQSVELEQHAEQIVSHLRERHGNDRVASVRIEDVFADIREASARVDALQSVLSSIQDGTSKQDLFAQLKQQLLQQAASERGCNKILMGESASQLAANFLAALAKVRSVVLARLPL